jgi:hypothetical protein
MALPPSPFGTKLRYEAKCIPVLKTIRIFFTFEIKNLVLS